MVADADVMNSGEQLCKKDKTYISMQKSKIAKSGIVLVVDVFASYKSIDLKRDPKLLKLVNFL